MADAMLVLDTQEDLAGDQNADTAEEEVDYEEEEGETEPAAQSKEVVDQGTAAHRSAPLLVDASDAPPTPPPPPLSDDTDPGAAETTPLSRWEADVGFGAGLYDAENAFQKLNRYLMLWNAGHLWNKASRFLFNRYRHFNLVYVRREPGQPPITIQCQEGIAQGCVLAMQTYGIALLPLYRRMRADIPEALQLWYADDASSVGSAEANARCLEYLVEHGPRYGYIPKPEKSWYICKSQDEEEARRAFDARGLTIGYSRGQRYLGGFVGTMQQKQHGWRSHAQNGQQLSARSLKWPLHGHRQRMLG